jgi:hypothetical protein
MNRIILKTILDNKSAFVPVIFTNKQVSIIKKYIQHEKLSYNEQHILYTGIKRKMVAMEILVSGKENLVITGRDKIIQKRIPLAVKLLKRFSPNNAFISGSFLFKEKYSDIDIFVIVRRGYKEVHEDTLHIIYLTQKRLLSQVFQSASLISIANFQIPSKVNRSQLKLSDIMALYHETVIEIMDKERREMARKLVFEYYLAIKNHLLDGKDLQEITQTVDLVALGNMVKEIIKKKYSLSYIYVALQSYVATLTETMRSEKGENLKKYKELYEEMLDEVRGSKAEAL